MQIDSQTHWITEMNIKATIKYYHKYHQISRGYKAGKDMRGGEKESTWAASRNVRCYNSGEKLTVLSEISMPGPYGLAHENHRKWWNIFTPALCTSRKLRATWGNG